jgi:hypothetical protein
MAYSINLGTQSQSVASDFRNWNMGQTEKYSGLLLCLVQAIDIHGFNVKRVVVNDS